MKKRQPSMYDIEQAERTALKIWLIFHWLCIIAMGVGLYFIWQYMKMPDRVIVISQDRTVYLGNSAPLDSRRVIEDVAMRATYALLYRRYDVQNDRAISFAFTKRGQGQAKGYLNDTQEMFTDRKIFQEIESVNMETAILNGQHHVLVKGTLVRRGIYFGHPYLNKLDFALMMRLEKSSSDKDLPYKVAGMKYWEEENNG